MRGIGLIALLGLVNIASTGIAQSADLNTISLSTGAAIPVAKGAGFDWNGFYAGVFGDGRDTAAGTQFGLGISAGINAQFDFYLLGAEVAVRGIAGSNVGETIYGQILGRAGLVITDDALVYAAGGYGIDFGAPSESDVLVGGGVEFAVSDSVTLRGQYLHTFPTQAGDAGDQFSVGAAFHF